MVKTLVLISACCAAVFAANPATAAGAAGEVVVGDSIDKVHSVLGEPRSYMGRGTYEILQYERGRVEMRDGRVAEVTLLSPEEAERRRLDREAQRRARTLARAEREAARHAEGVALKKQVTGDPEFAQMAAKQQLAFWTKFRSKYPGVSVDLEHAKVLAAAERERELERELQHARVMEARVAEAEQRAAEAERKAEEARRRSNRYTAYAPPFVDYTPLVRAHPYVVSVPIRPVCSRRKGPRTHSEPTVAQGGVRHNYTVDTRRSDLTFQQVEKVRSYPKSPSPITSPGASRLRIPHP